MKLIQIYVNTDITNDFDVENKHCNVNASFFIDENASGYDDSPLTRVEKLSGALLICHGMADDNVHFRNTSEYTEALVQADKDFSQLVYTNRNHGIYGGNTRLHLYRQCIQFFERELKK